MYKVLISFAGKANGKKGEIKDFPPYIAGDLLKAGYIEKVGEKNKSTENSTVKKDNTEKEAVKAAKKAKQGKSEVKKSSRKGGKK